MGWRRRTGGTHIKHQPVSLVSGGAGFLGSHLVDRLLQEGHRVICMDNLLTGSMENVAHLMGNPQFHYVNYDVTDYIYISGQVDNVFHFASPASPMDYLRLPIHTLKVGSIGTHHALGVAKSKGARFLLASTSEVYGDPLNHPQAEGYWGNVNPIGLRGVYDEAKRFSEAMTMAYHRSHGMETRVVRIFNTYGPRMRMDDGRAIPTFIMQGLRGEDVTVFGDGKQTRSVCYVDDEIDGIVGVLKCEHSEPVNIGNPDEVSVLQLAEEIIELTGGKSKIVFKPLPEDDPKVRQPHIGLAKKLFGWSPKIARRDGLMRTIKYFRQKLAEVH